MSDISSQSLPGNTHISSFGLKTPTNKAEGKSNSKVQSIAQKILTGLKRTFLDDAKATDAGLRNHHFSNVNKESLNHNNEGFIPPGRTEESPLADISKIGKDLIGKMGASVREIANSARQMPGLGMESLKNLVNKRETNSEPQPVSERANNDPNDLLDPKTIQSRIDSDIKNLTQKKGEQLKIDDQLLEKLYQSEEKNDLSKDHVLLAIAYREASSSKERHFLVHNHLFTKFLPIPISNNKLASKLAKDLKEDIETKDPALASKLAKDLGAISNDKLASKLAKDLGVSLASARMELIKYSSDFNISEEKIAEWNQGNSKYEEARRNLRSISSKIINGNSSEIKENEIKELVAKLANKEYLNTSSCLIDLFNIWGNKEILGLDSPTIQNLETAIRYGIRGVNTAHIYSLKELATNKFPASKILFYNVKTTGAAFKAKFDRADRLKDGIKLAVFDKGKLEELKLKVTKDEKEETLNSLNCTYIKSLLKEGSDPPFQERLEIAIKKLDNVIALQNGWRLSLENGNNVFIPGYFKAVKDNDFSTFLTNDIVVRGSNYASDFRGAFVAKRPALGYGTALFGFTEEIQWHHRALETYSGATEVWSGFNKPIPTNPKKTELNEEFTNLLFAEFNKKIDKSNLIDNHFKTFIKESLERKITGNFDIRYNPNNNKWNLHGMKKQKVGEEYQGETTPLTNKKEIEDKTKEVLSELAEDFSRSPSISKFFEKLSKESIPLHEVQKFAQNLDKEEKAFSGISKEKLQFCVIGIDDDLDKELLNKSGDKKTLKDLKDDMTKAGLDPKDVTMFSLIEMKIFSEYDQLNKVAFPSFHKTTDENFY